MVSYHRTMDVYAENILDHYRHPRKKSLLPSPGSSSARDGGGGFVTHEEVNVSCGDTLTVSLMIKDGTVAGIGWDGTGCAISQAAMSMLAEELPGKSVKDLEAMTKEDIYAMLAVPIGPRRLKCALLCLHALKNALRKAKGQDPQGWAETVESEQ